MAVYTNSDRRAWTASCGVALTVTAHTSAPPPGRGVQGTPHPDSSASSCSLRPCSVSKYPLNIRKKVWVSSQCPGTASGLVRKQGGLTPSQPILSMRQRTCRVMCEGAPAKGCWSQLGSHPARVRLVCPLWASMSRLQEAHGW